MATEFESFEQQLNLQAAEKLLAEMDKTLRDMQENVNNPDKLLELGQKFRNQEQAYSEFSVEIRENEKIEEQRKEMYLVYDKILDHEREVAAATRYEMSQQAYAQLDALRAAQEAGELFAEGKLEVHLDMRAQVSEEATQVIQTAIEHPKKVTDENLGSALSCKIESSYMLTELIKQDDYKGLLKDIQTMSVEELSAKYPCLEHRFKSPESNLLEDAQLAGQIVEFANLYGISTEKAKELMQDQISKLESGQITRKDFYDKIRDDYGFEFRELGKTFEERKQTLNEYNAARKEYIDLKNPEFWERMAEKHPELNESFSDRFDFKDIYKDPSIVSRFSDAQINTFIALANKDFKEHYAQQLEAEGKNSSFIVRTAESVTTNEYLAGFASKFQSVTGTEFNWLNATPAGMVADTAVAGATTVVDNFNNSKSITEAAQKTISDGADYITSKTNEFMQAAANLQAQITGVADATPDPKSAPTTQMAQAPNEAKGATIL